MRMFQAFFTIFTAIVLVMSTVGFSVSQHYCLGMLAQESFFHLGNESCSADSDADCGAETNGISKQCCDDVNLSIPGIQVQDRNPSEQESVALQDDRTSPFSLPDFPNFGVVVNDDTNFSKDPPPLHDSTGKRILIHQQRFLI